MVSVGVSALADSEVVLPLPIMHFNALQGIQTGVLLWETEEGLEVAVRADGGRAPAEPLPLSPQTSPSGSEAKSEMGPWNPKEVPRAFHFGTLCP